MLTLDREVGQQIPLYAGTPGQHIALLRLNHRQLERRVAVLFVDGWQRRHALVAKYEGYRRRMSLRVADGRPEAMYTQMVVTDQNILLADPIIRQKAVRCLH